MDYPNQDSSKVERHFQTQAKSRRMQEAGSTMAMKAIVLFVATVIVVQIFIHFSEVVTAILGGS